MSVLSDQLEDRETSLNSISKKAIKVVALLVDGMLRALFLLGIAGIAALAYLGQDQIEKIFAVMLFGALLYGGYAVYQFDGEDWQS